MKTFPNNKSRVSPQLKVLLNKKRSAFKVGISAILESTQKEIDRKLEELKRHYSRKLEENF